MIGKLDPLLGHGVLLSAQGAKNGPDKCPRVHARPRSASSLRQRNLRRGAVCTASYPARPNYVGNGPPMTEKKYSRIHLFVKSKKYAQKRKFIKYLFSIFIRPVRMINSFDFSLIKKNTDFRDIIEETAPDLTKETALKMLMWFSSNPAFKQYRTELLSEMIRSIKYAIDHDMSIFDAANHIRKDLGLQKRYTGFKFLSSRTLLSKGLEFDCVIIDMTTPLSAKDFYVAMTRAMKKIYIISDSNTFIFRS